MTKITNTNSCPCGSGEDYGRCCGQYHDLQQAAPNPEALMRSRYSAFVLAKVDYLSATMRGRALEGFEPEATASWASSVVWLGLEIVSAKQLNQLVGYVAFIAKYQEPDNNNISAIHEVSEFRFIEGCWYYTQGEPPARSRNLAEIKAKIGRNDPCPCGSGKKYKKCCLGE